MKNEDIHKGFSQSDIRDSLAYELRDSRMRLEPGIISTKYIERKIERLQNLLKYTKKYISTCQKIEDKGWKEWRIPYIPYNKETYFPFIGTEEEYNKLMKALQKER